MKHNGCHSANRSQVNVNLHCVPLLLYAGYCCCSMLCTTVVLCCVLLLQYTIYHCSTCIAVSLHVQLFLYMNCCYSTCTAVSNQLVYCCCSMLCTVVTLQCVPLLLDGVYRCCSMLCTAVALWAWLWHYYANNWSCI